MGKGGGPGGKGGISGGFDPITNAITSALDPKNVFGYFGKVFTSVGDFLFPPPEALDKVETLPVQAGEEGSPLARAEGQRARVPGTIIWVSDFKSEKGETGGKGGGSDGEPTKNKVDIAIHVANGPISAIIAIWANGRQIYGNDPQRTAVADTFTAVVFTKVKHGITETFLDVKSSGGDPSLSKMKTGVDLEISGWSSFPGNNYDGYRVVKKWKIFNSATGSKDHYIRLRDDRSPPQVEDATVGDTVTIEQDVPLFVKAEDFTILRGAKRGAQPTVVATDGSTHSLGQGFVILKNLTSKPTKWDRLTIADDPEETSYFVKSASTLVGGVSTVFVDPPLTVAISSPTEAVVTFEDELFPAPIIEASEGIGNVPAWNTECHILIDGFKVIEFGNAVPSSWEFLIEKDPVATVALAIDSIAQQSGLDGSFFDATGLNETLLGYPMPTPIATRQAILPLMVTFDLLSQETDGLMSFFKRADATPIIVAEEDLGGYIDVRDAQVTPEVDLGDVDEIKTPTEVAVKYFDSIFNYGVATTRERRSDGFITENRVNVNLGVALLKVDARKVAKRLLFTALLNRQTVSLTLPPKYGFVAPGDVLVFPFQGRTYNVLLQTVTYGLNGLIEMAGVVEETGVLDFDNLIADDGKDPNAEENPLPEITSNFMDIAAVRESDVLVPGVYVGVDIGDEEVAFQGAVLYRSDDGINWSIYTVLERTNVMGTALTVLTGDVNPRLWDRVSSVDVVLDDDTELTSITDRQAEQGFNLTLIGNEILSWRVATLIAFRTYRLTEFLRGLRGTEASVPTSQHLVGERFVPLGDLPITQLQTNTNNKSFFWKVVPFGGDETDYPDSIQFTHTLETLRPLKPINIQLDPLVADPVTTIVDRFLVWTPRTRHLIDPLSPEQNPVAEEEEKYIVEWRGPTSVSFPVPVLLRTQEVFTNATEYTAAEQNTDDFDPDVTFGIPFPRVYQVSASVGRGPGAGLGD